MTADRCPACDNPVASDADYLEAQRLTDQHGHSHVVQHFSGTLCWRRFGQPCEPYDWRSECLRLRGDATVRLGDLHAMLTAAGIRQGSIGQRIGWALEDLRAWQDNADALAVQISEGKRRG